MLFRFSGVCFFFSSSFFWSIFAHILSTLYHSVHFKRTTAVVEVKANKPIHRFWLDTEVAKNGKRVCTESSREERIPSQGIKPASVLINHLIFSILTFSQMPTKLSFCSSSSLPFFFLFIISLTPHSLSHGVNFVAWKRRFNGKKKFSQLCIV